MSIRPGGRDPARQRRQRKPGQRGGGDRGDAAADKGLAPGDAGLVERTQRNRAHAAGRRQYGKSQRFAAPPGKAWRGEPAEFVLGEFFAAAPAAFLAHDDGIELAGIVGVEDFAREPVVTDSASCGATALSRSISGTSSGPAA